MTMTVETDRLLSSFADMSTSISTRFTFETFFFPSVGRRFRTRR
jgi:hypothetical protein